MKQFTVRQIGTMEMQQVADNLSTMIKANKNLLDFGVLGSKTVLRMLSKYVVLLVALTGKRSKVLS